MLFAVVNKIVIPISNDAGYRMVNGTKYTVCVREKNETFFVIKYLLQNSGDSGENWYTVSWINLLQNH